MLNCTLTFKSTKQLTLGQRETGLSILKSRYSVLRLAKTPPSCTGSTWQPVQNRKNNQTFEPLVSKSSLRRIFHPKGYK